MVVDTSKASRGWVKHRMDKVQLWKERLGLYIVGYCLDEANDLDDEHLVLLGKYLFRGPRGLTQMTRSSDRTEGILGNRLRGQRAFSELEQGHEDVCIRAWVLQTEHETRAAGTWTGGGAGNISGRPGFAHATAEAARYLQDGQDALVGRFVTASGALLNWNDVKDMVGQCRQKVDNIVRVAVKADPFLKYVDGTFILRASLLADDPTNAPNVHYFWAVRIGDEILSNPGKIGRDAQRLLDKMSELQGQQVLDGNLEGRIYLAVQGARDAVRAPGWSLYDLIKQLHGDAQPSEISTRLLPLAADQRDVLFATAVIAAQFGEIRCLVREQAYWEVAQGIRAYVGDIRPNWVHDRRIPVFQAEADDNYSWWGF